MASFQPMLFLILAISEQANMQCPCIKMQLFGQDAGDIHQEAASSSYSTRSNYTIRGIASQDFTVLTRGQLRLVDPPVHTFPWLTEEISYACGLYYSERNDDVLLNHVNDVIQCAEGQGTFCAKDVLVLTWDRVSLSPCAELRPNEGNTFQMLLATDNAGQTYVLIQYTNLEGAGNIGEALVPFVTFHPLNRNKSAILDADNCCPGSVMWNIGRDFRPFDVPYLFGDFYLKYYPGTDGCADVSDPDSPNILECGCYVCKGSIEYCQSNKEFVLFSNDDHCEDGCERMCMTTYKYKYGRNPSIEVKMEAADSCECDKYQDAEDCVDTVKAECNEERYGRKKKCVQCMHQECRFRNNCSA